MSGKKPITRARWLLDRIRRGQFTDLGTYSVEHLKAIYRGTVLAYDATPPSHETYRGRLMLLLARIGAELSDRERPKKAGKGKSSAGVGDSPRQRALCKCSNTEIAKILKEGATAAKRIPKPPKSSDKLVAARVRVRNDAICDEYALRASAVLREIAKGQI